MIQDAFEEALERIKDAKKGIVAPSIFFKNQNTGIPLSLNKRMRLGNGTYMVVTGPPGTGKTSLVDSEFVMNPILDCIIDPATYANIYCIYRSMEKPIINKVTKFIAYMLYLATEGQVILDTATLLGYHNKKRDLTDEDIALISELRGHINEIAKHLDLVSGPDTPEGVKQYILKTLYRLGTYIQSDLEHVYINGKKTEKTFDLTDEYGRPYCLLRGKTGKEIKVGHMFNQFIPTDPKMIIEHVTDTTNKIRKPKGSSVLDTSNDYTFIISEFVEHRAICAIDINQFGKESEKDLKGKSGNSLSVGLSDIKGSGDFMQNAQIGLSILDPTYLGISRWGGDPGGRWPDMEVDRFHGTLRILQIFKNSDGQSMYKMPCVMLGEMGYFQEIPNPKEITEKDYADINNTILRHLNPSAHNQPIQMEAFQLPDNMIIKKRPKTGGKEQAPF